MLIYRIYNHFAAHTHSPIHTILISIFGEKAYCEWMNRMETLPINHLYNESNTKVANLKEGVVLMCDGKIYNTGLADRLRAIVSVYYWAKLNGSNFYIYFNSPFELADYLTPNKYNWLIDKDELSYNSSQSTSKALISFKGIFGEDDTRELHRNLLDSCKFLKGKQIHLYSNTDCNDDYFYECYNELFKPSKQLEDSLSFFQNQIGGKYITASFRFTQLLGDLKDTFGQLLAETERCALIEKCKQALLELHALNPEYNKILVTSDSCTFIDALQQLPFVYVIPGEIGHIANKVSDTAIAKTFWDMYMISRADKAYMIRTPEMYRSGFAKRSAMIGNVPFEEILLR